MKIAFVSEVGALENSPAADGIRLVNKLTRQQIGKVKAKDTEVAFHMPRAGTGMTPEKYSYLRCLEDAEILHGYMEVAKSGNYDAIVGWCFLDPMKREARQALDIPFVGIAETAMHVACMMGAKFGIVAPHPEGAYVTDEYVRTLGLQDRAVPSRALPMENPWAALEDAHKGIEAMIEVSRELIADGAEIIIPGCVLADLMAATVPACEREYPNGLRGVDDVPIMDVGACAIKFAESLVEAKNAGIPWISRKHYYCSAEDDKMVMQQTSAVLEYKGPGFWLD